MLKKVAKTFRRWDVKSVLESGVGGNTDGLSSLPTLPSLIREGKAPILLTDLGDLHHDNLTEKNLTTYRLNVLSSFLKIPAFTLAEVLITLGVIGVVAAMTMSVLINHIKDQQYDRARQKALASIGEAGRLIAIEGDMGAAANAEDFVKNILSKKLSIAKMCDTDHLGDCGWADTITVLGKGENMQGEKTVAPPKTITDIANYVYNDSKTNALKSQKSYGFVTANGYSVDLFYNPNCITDTNNNDYKSHDYVCINAIYDMNGKANPNEVGKDIGFVTVLYPDETNRAVAPNPTIANVGGTYDDPSSGSLLEWKDANKACSDKGYTLPDKEELQSLAYNSLLTNLAIGVFWSGSVWRGHAGQAWYVLTRDGGRGWYNLDSGFLVRCVKR